MSQYFSCPEGKRKWLLFGQMTIGDSTSHPLRGLSSGFIMLRDTTFSSF